MLPALGLGADPPARGIMRKPPRPPQERLLNRALLLRAYLFLGVLEATAAMAAYAFALHEGGWLWGELLEGRDPLYLQATTACLSAIILMQVVNVFLCKTPERSLFGTHIFANRLLLWGVALEIALILVIVYTPWGHSVFGTAPITPAVWLFMLLCAVAMLLLEEGRKWLAVRWNRKSGDRTTVPENQSQSI